MKLWLWVSIILFFFSFTFSLNYYTRTFLEIKIWIYWSKSNSWIYFYIPVVLNKNWKFYWSWDRGPNEIVNEKKKSMMLTHNHNFMRKKMWTIFPSIFIPRWVIQIISILLIIYLPLYHLLQVRILLPVFSAPSGHKTYK
jgi:hypothetical protein